MMIKILVLPLLLHFILTKSTEFSLSVRKLIQEKSIFIGKMTYSIGQKNFNLSIDLYKPMKQDESKTFKFTIAAINREHWGSHLKGCDIISHSLKVFDIDVNQNGESNINNISIELPYFYKKQFILFYLVDCYEQAKEMPDNRNRFEGKIETKNTNDSHFEDSHSHVVTFNIFWGI